MSQPHNLIAGSPVPAASGGQYSAPDGERWPRSGVDDVARALSAARSPDWSGRTGAERRRILARAARLVREDLGPTDRVAEALELAPRELDDLEGDLEHALENAAGAPDTALGPRLFLPHWSGLARRSLTRLFRALASGDPVTWIVDAHLPELSGFAPLLLEAGVDPRALAVLHDDGDTALRAALASGGYAALHSSGSSGRRKRLAGAIARPGRESGAPAPFGAGVVDPRPVKHEHETFESAAAEVARDDDPEDRAAEIAERAFGRARTLTGQLPGSVGRVFVHPRGLSRFTAALLAEVEERAERLGAPLKPRERATTRALADARDLGLDEGATLLHDGPASGSQRAAGGAILDCLVFTNVEPHMRLAALRRPMPLLSILRGDEPS